MVYDFSAVFCVVDTESGSGSAFFGEKDLKYSAVVPRYFSFERARSSHQGVWLLFHRLMFVYLHRTYQPNTVHYSTTFRINLDCYTDTRNPSPIFKKNSNNTCKVQRNLPRNILLLCRFHSISHCFSSHLVVASPLACLNEHIPELSNIFTIHLIPFIPLIKLHRPIYESETWL